MECEQGTLTKGTVELPPDVGGTLPKGTILRVITPSDPPMTDDAVTQLCNLFSLFYNVDEEGQKLIFYKITNEGMTADMLLTADLSYSGQLLNTYIVTPVNNMLPIAIGVAAPIAVGTTMLIFYLLGMPKYLILKPFVWKL